MKRAMRTNERMRDERDAPPAPRASVPDPARITQAVAALAEPVLVTSGCTLDRIEYHAAGRRGVVQVYIDKPGGVSVEDCANVSRQLSVLLDQDDVVPMAYTLEVSSPGLTRPLNDERDFVRFAGRLAVLHCRVPVRRGEYQLLGRLQGVEAGAVVVLDEASGETFRVPLDKVKKARLEIEGGDGGADEEDGENGDADGGDE